MAAWTFKHQENTTFSTGTSITTSTGLASNVSVGDVLFLYAAGGFNNNTRTFTAPAGFTRVRATHRSPYWYNGGGFFTVLDLWYMDVASVPSSLTVTRTTSIGGYSVGWFNYTPPSLLGVEIQASDAGTQGPASSSPYTPASLVVPADANVHLLVAPKGPDPIAVSAAAGFTTDSTWSTTPQHGWSGHLYSSGGGTITMPTLVNQPPSTAFSTWNHVVVSFTTPRDQDHYWPLCANMNDIGPVGGANFTPLSGSRTYADECGVC